MIRLCLSITVMNYIWVLPQCWSIRCWSILMISNTQPGNEESYFSPWRYCPLPHETTAAINFEKSHYSFRDQHRGSTHIHNWIVMSVTALWICITELWISIITHNYSYTWLSIINIPIWISTTEFMKHYNLLSLNMKYKGWPLKNHDVI